MENKKIETEQEEEDLEIDAFLDDISCNERLIKKSYTDVFELYVAFAIVISRTVRRITPAEIEKELHDALEASLHRDARRWKGDQR